MPLHVHIHVLYVPVAPPTGSNLERLTDRDNKENRSPGDAVKPMEDGQAAVASPSRKPLAEGSVQLAYYSEPDSECVCVCE